MIIVKTGDILAEPAEALVNTVNCVGVMGRGIALQFRNAFPDNFRAYEAACKRGEVRPGRMFVFAREALDPPRWIINFPTKRHWRGRSRIEDIEAGLAALVEEIRARAIRSIAIPHSAAGLAASTGPRCGRASRRRLQPCRRWRSRCSSRLARRRPDEASPRRRPHACRRDGRCWWG